MSEGETGDSRNASPSGNWGSVAPATRHVNTTPKRRINVKSGCPRHAPSEDIGDAKFVRRSELIGSG